MSDSVPLLVFTGQVNRAGIGKDAFQEADIVGITMPITKFTTIKYVRRQIFHELSQKLSILRRLAALALW